MRYGYVDCAQRVTAGLLDAAPYFDHRLPELFCEFGRDRSRSTRTGIMTSIIDPVAQHVVRCPDLGDLVWM
jgi:hypothetical protein